MCNGTFGTSHVCSNGSVCNGSDLIPEYFIQSGAFRGGSGGSLEPPSESKFFQFHWKIYESGKMLGTNPLCEFEPPFQKSWICPCIFSGCKLPSSQIRSNHAHSFILVTFTHVIFTICYDVLFYRGMDIRMLRTLQVLITFTDSQR